MNGGKLGLLLGLAAVAVGLSGCSKTRYLGRVGDMSFFSVHAQHCDGPNLTALVSCSPHCGTRVEEVFGGPGLCTQLAPAAVMAGGYVGAAAALRPDRINVAASGGTGGSGTTNNAAAISQQIDQSQVNDSSVNISSSTTGTITTGNSTQNQDAVQAGSVNQQ